MGCGELTAHQKSILSDFFQAMPPTKADRVMGWSTGTCARLVRAGEIAYIKKPGTSRVLVTPSMLADYIECVTVTPIN